MKCEYLNICKFYSADTCNGDSFHCVNDDVKQLRKKESARTKGSASSAEPAGRESVNVPKILGKSRLKTISERSFFINFTLK